jgi:hypothetical protein
MSDHQNQKSNQNSGQNVSIDFTTFTLSIGSAAFMGLGIAPRPDTGKAEVDLTLAQQNIELLAMMKEKTKGNLTADEIKLLDHLLFETRMRFVELSKSVKK